jgi:hypothetical protein
MRSCPYCTDCADSCGREIFRSPARNRSVEVLAAVRDLASRLPEVLDMDPLYVTQELVYFGYFQDPPTLTDTGTALDILRVVEREQ